MGACPCRRLVRVSVDWIGTLLELWRIMLAGRAMSCAVLNLNWSHARRMCRFVDARAVSCANAVWAASALCCKRLIECLPECLMHSQARRSTLRRAVLNAMLAKTRLRLSPASRWSKLDRTSGGICLLNNSTFPKMKVAMLMMVSLSSSLMQ